MHNEHTIIKDFAYRPLDAERAHSALYKLLRLSPPDARYGEALEYLVQSHALQPKHSAAIIHQWSYTQLATSAHTWLYDPATNPTELSTTHQTATQQDEWLTALWVWEELKQCQTDPWLQAVSHRLITNTAFHHTAPHTAAGLPTEPQHTTPDILKHWLQRMGIDAPWGETPLTPAEATQHALLSIYCQHPFPWTALLKAVSASSVACHPSVQRLHTQQQQLLTLLQDPSAATAFHLHSWAQQIETLQSLSSLPMPYPPPTNTGEAHIPIKASRCRPLRGVLLVEGTSEIVLLPAIASALQISLPLHGIQLVAVGGKSLMMKHYCQLAGFVDCPITALLDADGADEQQQLTRAMSPKAPHHCAIILPEGTLEDALSDALVAQTVNAFYDPPEPLTAQEIALRRKAGRAGNQTITALETLFSDWELASPRKGSHKEKQFNKVDFAYHVAQTLLTYPPTTLETPVSESLAALIHHAVKLANQALPPLQA